MSFPRYERYKDSGVEWLRDVPEDWQIVPIKRLSPVKRGASPRPIEDPKFFDDGGDYAWVRIADVTKSGGVLRRTEQQLSHLGSSLSVKLQSGALFVSIAGSVGKPCISAIKACIHDGFVYFPSLKIDSRYLYRVFEAGNCYGGLGKFGTQLNLNTDTIGAIRIALPKSDEVNRILRFLDHETAKIDALIQEQQRLIELLNEKLKAVISNAVTRGLNPSAPMKASGVEWMGLVPSHWRLLPLGRAAVSACDGPFGSGLKSNHYVNEGVRVIRLQNIKANHFDGRDAVFIDESYYATLGDHDVRAGDVLIAGLGDENNFVGRACVAPRDIGPAMVKADCFRFRLAGGIHPYFVASQLSAGASGDGRLITGSTRLRISLSRTASRAVALPDGAEQGAIMYAVDRLTAEFGQLEEQIHKGIALLQERRSALISAAVTGKIDVRNYMPSYTLIPDEISQPA